MIVLRRTVAILSMLPTVVMAAADGTLPFLSWVWVLPFIGILLSTALFPMFAESLWHHHTGKIIAVWTASFLVPYAIHFGPNEAARVVLHALLTEYLPFIVLLLTLYTISGGVWIKGNLHGSPRLNTALLALGTALASLLGTTGAAMLLIRPLLRANDNRRHRVHVVIFFIFLVANIGGGLTPLGDPPLFLGFLNGVTFGWTFTHMLGPVLVTALVLLSVFYLIDSYWYRKEGVLAVDVTPDAPIRIVGKRNLILLLLAVAAVLLSSLWRPHITLPLVGNHLPLQHVVRDMVLLLLSAASLWCTPRAVRVGNQFNWGPIGEVAVLFAGIFITIIPAIAMLKLGHAGGFGSVLSLVSDAHGRPIDAMYFWLTGLLSSFLDNAPTYLVFFYLASGEPQVLMGPMATTLLAISMGAVFMGANTYIGNAPNFMIKAIAERSGIAMPGFFTYMLWSSAVLLPLFAVLTLLMF